MDALLVIDVQSSLVTGAWQETQVLEAISATMRKVRAGGGSVFFIQHCHATFPPLKQDAPGWELHESLDVRETDGRINKEASDAFCGTLLHEQLQESGVSHLFVTGLQTEYCVDATCRAALSRGYEVTLVSDAHTTGDALLPAAQIIAHHNALLANLAHPTQQIQVRSSSDI